MKTHTRIPRILARAQWRTHRQQHFAKLPGWSTASKDLGADIAATETNMEHNPQTGHKEFAKGTPAWVVRIAARRGWTTKVGTLEWKP